MNKLFTAVRHMSKRTALTIATLAAVVLVPAALFAYGPVRETFTMKKPAPYVTFNSITDNPTYGDEREFVTVKDVTANTQIDHSANLVEGHEYLVQMYVHNDASDALNASGKGIAKGVKIQAKMPTTVDGSAKLWGYLYAKNAKPTEVYDSAALKSTKKVALEYIAGSSRISTNYFQSGLSDSMVKVGEYDMPLGGGVSIGHKDLSGTWNGCIDYAGIVTYRFRVKQPVTPKPAVDITKTVNSKKTAEVKVNQPFTYELTVKNTGTVDLTNVAVTDKSPHEGITFTGTDKGTIVNNSLNYTIPSLKVGASVSIKITAKATKYIAGVTTNTACVNAPAVNPNEPTKDDDCDTSTTTMPEPIKVCELATKKVITINPEDFDSTKHSKVLADCEPKKVTACNLTTKKIEQNVDESKIDNIHYTLDLEKCKEVEKVKACNLDTMKIEENVDKTKIDNVHYTLDLDKCKPAEKTIEVCRLSDKKYPVTIKESEFDSSKYSKDPAACKTEDKDIVVCRLSDKTYPVTIKESEFDSSKYSKDAADCETTETPMCEVPGKEHLPADSEDCVEEETPEELPHTGMGETLLSVLGAGSLASAAGAYIASRRK